MTDRVSAEVCQARSETTARVQAIRSHGQVHVVLPGPLFPSKQMLRLRFYATVYAADGISLIAGFLLTGYLAFGDVGDPYAVDLLLIMIPLYSLLAFQTNAYGLDMIRRPRLGIYRALVSLAATAMVILLVAFFLKASEDLSRIVFVGGIVLAAGSIAVLRFVMANLGWRTLHASPVNELVIVDGAYYPETLVSQVLNAADHGLTPNPRDPFMLDRLGQMLENVDRVVVACAPQRRAQWALLLKGTNIQGELLSLECEQVGAIGVGKLGDRATLAVSCGPLDLRSRALKRALDLSVAVPLLVFLAPLFLLVAFLIKIDSPGPVFFLQKRVGRGNRMFLMTKFRSMRIDACDSDGARSTSEDDDRVTRLGHLLRKASIDELPQLINVVRGEMSLVGPRPHALQSLAGDKLFWEVDDRYWHRHACKPGITGLAQVRGFRGATREKSDLTDRLKADLEYLSGWSIWRDIIILFRTVRVLVHPRAF
ncbi:sugar transferase [Sphingosinicella humi]|nr:sugar transferase [Sphingosinicella humi]